MEIENPCVHDWQIVHVLGYSPFTYAVLVCSKCDAATLSKEIPVEVRLADIQHQEVKECGGMS